MTEKTISHHRSDESMKAKAKWFQIFIDLILMTNDNEPEARHGYANCEIMNGERDLWTH